MTGASVISYLIALNA